MNVGSCRAKAQGRLVLLCNSRDVAAGVGHVVSHFHVHVGELYVGAGRFREAVPSTSRRGGAAGGKVIHTLMGYLKSLTNTFLSIGVAVRLVGGMFS